jgi:hypothetical protein
MRCPDSTGLLRPNGSAYTSRSQGVRYPRTLSRLRDLRVEDAMSRLGEALKKSDMQQSEATSDSVATRRG